MNSNTTVKSN